MAAPRGFAVYEIQQKELDSRSAQSNGKGAKTMNNLYYMLLQSYCDALISVQDHGNDPAFRGGIYCRSCKMIHGRCPDAVYGFVVMAKLSGDDKYLQAAKDVFGYFAMDRDLDFAKTEISEWATDWNWDHGFRGTLDGMGHSLTNYRSLMYGITAQMGKGAVIKNLKFVDARYDGGETTFFARGACGVTFENIEITLSADSSCSFSSNENSCGVLVSHDMRQCVYKNITIHAEGKELQRIFGGTNQERNSSTYDNIKIYAVSVERYENDTSRRPKGVSLIKG